ncbi:MAG TPA: hypothetical protein VLL77_12305 [Anaerolineales bacterium]|nr:hypothetical protein [Anaerolineales bacterium]
MAEAKRGREGEWKPGIPDETREHLHAAREAFRRSYEGLFPPEFVAHRREARKEMLLAARSLIDHALKRMEERGEA